MPIPAALKRRRDYAGPVLLSYGFRPFFLGAAIWAVVGILLWIPQYFGEIRLRSHFGALDWHIHEMLYGYAAAAMAGFLLTAIPNWTGRLPVNGMPLAALASLWIAGRIVMLMSSGTGALIAAVIDVGFLLTLGGLAASEVIAGRNWRNLRVVAVLGALGAGNMVFHAEVWLTGSADYGIRMALGAVIALIMLVGGRIIPSFTNNWLVRNNPGRLPVPFSRFDATSIAAGVVALFAWIAAPDHVVTGALLLAAGAFHVVRLARWAGDRTTAERLVLVLHVGYAFIPVGFIFLGVSVFLDSVPRSAGIHAWASGAIALMTLAVMTRATLGHTGNALVASPATHAIYGFAVLAAVLRIVAAFDPSITLLHLAAFAWVAAFGGFVIVYGPHLIGRPPAWSRATGSS